MTRVIILCILLHLSIATREADNVKENYISTDLTDLSRSKTIAEGILIGAVGELAKISLTSLQQTKISFGSASSVAFNWNSSKVYWAELDPIEGVGIKTAKLDGTDVEHLAEVHSVSVEVDSITGNIYYQNFSSFDIRVCNLNGEKCSVLATNQFALSDIALFPSKSLMFWTNHSAVVRANMDGTNVTVILREKALRVALDENSDRLYWIGHLEKCIASCDISGEDQRVLLNATKKLRGVAVQGDVVFFTSFGDNGIQSISKDGRSPAVVVVNTTSYVHSMAFYGTKGSLPENPCGSSPCSQLCVLKYESFACLCPEGQRLDQDGTTCI